jgi:hypothetical protein
MSLAPSLLLAASGLVYWAINSRSSSRKKVVKDKTTQTTPTVVLNDTQALINKLVEYKKQNPAFTYVIGVDVGATNFRTAFIFTNSNNVNSTFEIKLQCRNMNFFRNFYAELGEQVVKNIGVKPQSSVLALAGPIKGDCVEITNYDEGARELFVNELTDLLFPRGKTKFINDLEAACYGIISLGVEKKLNDYMASLWLPNEKSNLSVDLADVSCKNLFMRFNSSRCCFVHGNWIGSWYYSILSIVRGKNQIQTTRIGSRSLFDSIPSLWIIIL